MTEPQTETRRASCSCGDLQVDTIGEPVAVGMCHCLCCQKRSGSPFGVQARFLVENVTLHGQATRFVRQGDSGKSVDFFFCPRCGTSLYWQPEALPGFISVAIGGFADPNFRAPDYSVYETSRHPWIGFETEMEHYD